MSRENVEIVRRLLEGLEPSLYDLLDPDVEFDARTSPGPYAGVYYGHAGVKRFLRRLGTELG